MSPFDSTLPSTSSFGVPNNSLAGNRDQKNPRAGRTLYAVDTGRSVQWLLKLDGTEATITRENVATYAERVIEERGRLADVIRKFGGPDVTFYMERTFDGYSAIERSATLDAAAWNGSQLRVINQHNSGRLICEFSGKSQGRNRDRHAACAIARLVAGGIASIAPPLGRSEEKLDWTALMPIHNAIRRSPKGIRAGDSRVGKLISLLPAFANLPVEVKAAVGKVRTYDRSFVLWLPEFFEACGSKRNVRYRMGMSSRAGTGLPRSTLYRRAASLAGGTKALKAMASYDVRKAALKTQQKAVGKAVLFLYDGWREMRSQYLPREQSCPTKPERVPPTPPERE